MTRNLILAMGIVAAAPHAAWARQDVRLETQMFVERVQTDINGRARRILANADRIAPGDRLVLVVNWRNEGRRAVNGLALTNPVPRGTSLSLEDPAAQVSVDGGQTWGRLDQLWLPTTLGGVRRAVSTDITHVRLKVPARISPGDRGRLSYRAIVR
ncbi:hypothetical protein [Sphingobium mellinum]|uniref:hypothetical protein n=1 Tax=Sphingobium mellinum TaxID=1387166 RepID=UPI0030EE4C8F